MDAFHSRRNWGTSTSAPARKVSTMPAKAPMKLSHEGMSIENALPTTKPPNSSISATEMPDLDGHRGRQEDRSREKRCYSDVAHLYLRRVERQG